MYPNIEGERAKRKMSNEQLASYLNITRKTLYSWLKFGTVPNEAICKMAKLFNCSPDFLSEYINEK